MSEPKVSRSPFDPAERRFVRGTMIAVTTSIWMRDKDGNQILNPAVELESERKYPDGRYRQRRIR